MKRLLGAAHGMNRPSAPKHIPRQAATCQERRDTGLQPLCTRAPTRMTVQVCTPQYMWHTMQPRLHRSRGQRPFGSQHQTNKCRPSRTARSPRAGAMLSCGWCMPPHSPVCLRLQTTLRARWPQPHEQPARHRRRAAAVPRSASYAALADLAPERSARARFALDCLRSLASCGCTGCLHQLAAAHGTAIPRTASSRRRHIELFHAIWRSTLQRATFCESTRPRVHKARSISSSRASRASMLQPGPKVSTDPVCRCKAYTQSRLFGAGARTGAGMPPASFSTSTSSMWHGDDMYAAAVAHSITYGANALCYVAPQPAVGAQL